MNLTSSPQTAGCMAGAAGLMLNVTNSAELLRDGAERAAGCYAAVRIPKPPKPPKPPRLPKKHGTGTDNK